MRLRTLALLILALLPASARAEPLMDAIRTGQWTQADTLAATAADPLVRRLVLYYRLLTPGAARAAEIAAFMAESPDWPNQALLSRRLQEALALDKDDRTVLEICRNHPPTAVPSLLRCADAESNAGLPDAAAAARKAWLTGIIDAPGEAAFMKRWGAQLSVDDQWHRFDWLAWTQPSAPNGPAARQAFRLPPALRAEAEVRLALRRDDPTAPALFHALPAPLQTDPNLVIELARWYRRAGQDHDAAAVWTGPGVAAEAIAAPERRQAFWDERNLLARRLLRASEPALAYAVVAAPAASRDAALDQRFLAGWIALRRLDDPATAIQHFTALAGMSGSAITQGRAHYWLGRAHQAAGRADQARAEFDAAAAWPTTYYGQLAALARGDDAATLSAHVAAAQDPGWTGQRALAFLAQDPARAAVLLAAWGEKARAKPFLARLDDLAKDPVERALAARLALGLGLPDEAVAIARRAGRDGVMLPGAGWPAPVSPPTSANGGDVEQAVVLGLIRQESSFDAQAQSPVGARGLMQLMPATAAAVARKLGLPPAPAALTEAGYNMRLGTNYLGGLLTRFNQALPLAIAGYNAGPSRVQDWLAAQDPPSGAAAMIDWIELIPFNETRNYVQRVIENIVVYRAQLGVVAPHPVEPNVVAGATSAAPG
jgi:soluble lytic murein transglycosylase